MTTPHERLLQKIRALRAMAQDASCTEEEAASFAAKVQQLLEQHNLSVADLAHQEQGHVAQADWSQMYDDPWRRQIARQTAMLYFCDMFLSEAYEEAKGKFRPVFSFIGRPHNCEVAISMTGYLLEATSRLALAYSRQPAVQFDSGTTPRAARLDFERGCGLRLADRVHDLRLSREKPRRRADGNPANLPALREDEEALVEEFKKTLDLKPHGRGTARLGAHADEGARAADGVSLSAQVSARAGSLLPTYPRRAT